ncbi:nucleotide exchange factor GrpE [Oscillatoria laete-virens NRMC-F 0139]|nr:nucleotide exchange factor GrpE [Oscillatoria laete-virens]MDL5053165.1 nucleotide exchange factor GrpE [Oscillatoria laete-virens NRMC-F 0139]
MSKHTDKEPEIILTDADADSTTSGETPAAPLSAEELDALRQKAALADELQDKNLRLVADMDNLRKRYAQEKADAVKYANESLLEALLPILDNFELALQSMDQTDNVQALKDGVKMVLGQFKQNLKQEGLEEISALGAVFDHNLHEAIAQEVSDDHPEGTVIGEKRKGYLIKGKLLRPASVVVSKPSGSEE